MLALVHPMLADCRTGIWRQPFESGRLRSRRGDNRRVVHCATLFEGPVHRGNGGTLLPDRHVDAAHLQLLVSALPVLTLVEDGVDADGGLAGLAVADDQLPLAAADRGH